MKKILILLVLAMSLVFVSCNTADNKNVGDKKEASASEESKKTEESTEETSNEDNKEDAAQDNADMKDKVNIKYFDDFKDGEVLAIANITNNNDKEDLIAAYHVKELLLSENDDAKEYLVFPKEDNTDLTVKSKDSDAEGETFTLSQKFGLKLAISDSDLDKFVLSVKQGDKTYDISIKLKEDGRLDLPKEAVEVLFKWWRIKQKVFYAW